MSNQSFVKLTVSILFFCIQVGFLNCEPKEKEGEKTLNMNAAELNNKGAELIGSNPEEAIKLFKAAHELDPNQPDYVNNIGVVKLGQKKLEDALDYFIKSTEISANYQRGFYNQGVCYQQLGKNDKAASAYKKAEKINSSPEISFNLGIIYTRLGDKAEAIKNYKRFIEIAPKDQLAEPIKDAQEKIKNLSK